MLCAQSPETKNPFIPTEGAGLALPDVSSACRTRLSNIAVAYVRLRSGSDRVLSVPDLSRLPHPVLHKGESGPVSNTLMITGGCSN